MSAILIIVVITIVLIAINALYVAAEFATVSARRHRIAQEADRGNRLARMLEPVMADPSRLDMYVAACQLGITASSLLLGFYGQSAIARALTPALTNLGGLQQAAAQSIAATVVLIGLTILQVVLGELVPKSVAIRYPERLALLTVVPMRWSMLLFRPAIALFNGTGVLLLRLLGIHQAEHATHIHSPEEIDLLVAESAKGGLLEADERQLLRNALRIGKLTAADVMIPRTNLVAAPLNTPLPQLLTQLNESGYTRVPRYRETIDAIAGIVHLKDLFRLHLEGRSDVDGVLRAVPFVPETVSAVEVWNLLRREDAYVAIVFDEFGGTAGMITVEDLLEEIFGELQDEFDEETPLIEASPDGRVHLRGDVLIADINDRFNLKLPNDDVHTIGGLLLGALGRQARVGDEVPIGEVVLRAEAVSGLAIRAVSMQLPDAAKPDAPHEEQGHD